MSPKWLKFLLVVYGLFFTILGFFWLSSENGGEFRFHFVSIFVEICFGAVITYAFIEENFKRDRKARLLLMLRLGNWRIADYSKSIIYVSLNKFFQGFNAIDQRRLNDILERINGQTETKDPESDILEAMWEGLTLWENRFFNGTEPRRDYPAAVLSNFKEVDRYIKHIKNMSQKFEEIALELNQDDAIFGFELVAESIEDTIVDFKGGKKVNLMAPLHLLLIASINMYQFSLAYHESISDSESFEIYKFGFKFIIKKPKSWSDLIFA